MAMTKFSGKIVSFPELRARLKKEGINPDTLTQAQLRDHATSQQAALLILKEGLKADVITEMLEILFARVEAGIYIPTPKAAEMEKTALNAGKKEDARKAFNARIAREQNFLYTEIEPWVDLAAMIFDAGTARRFAQVAEKCDDHREKVGTALKRLAPVMAEVSSKIAAKFRPRLDRYRRY